MRGAWVMIAGLAGAAPVACSGDPGTDSANTDDSGTTEKLPLCERHPVSSFAELNCNNVESNWYTVYEEEGKRCDVEEDCRLTNGYCAQNLTSLQQIAVNSCLTDSEISRYATASAPCDYRISCSQNQPNIVGVACEFGECVPVIE